MQVSASAGKCDYKWVHMSAGEYMWMQMSVSMSASEYMWVEVHVSASACECECNVSACDCEFRWVQVSDSAGECKCRWMRVLFDVMAYLLTSQRTSWRTFWYYNIFSDVMTHFVDLMNKQYSFKRIILIFDTP